MMSKLIPLTKGFSAIVDDAVIAADLARLAAPHPCPGCNDLTCDPLCAACQEWAGRVLAMEPHTVS